MQEEVYLKKVLRQLFHVKTLDQLCWRRRRLCKKIKLSQLSGQELKRVKTLHTYHKIYKHVDWTVAFCAVSYNTLPL
ncbi:unnamed protein product [Acanthoscelides obtectus]|uniref:Uncharacterized protein n=1 Tax=Acanthoscelides obtectus TaxID=200917 RepID=A0A9P0JUF0_ACAOB|nr:unnamed protein product [Acanthoscelides obtectus]CAK1647906.1 hypothetical protein AOBTE_LOCUS15449 [Acanthoscelides obtectus]